ncbi:hypothetical protein [Streptomyces sp. GMY02]|uniref:hypothetical protein n=1 Tax=Streptomyces sp. GMY02 TaxID=1333528 RepID=UPI0020B6A828|nr:hypothetical protein [Streptomyces sp. GMY02]
MGVLALGFGGLQLLVGTGPGGVAGVALWLAGAVVLHDGVLVPLVLAAGLLIAGTRLRPVLRAGLLTAGCLTLLALPLLLRPGKPGNPSVLPHDYPLNWAIVVGSTAAATALAAGCVALASRLGKRARTEG